jgi:hypothetical protein
MKKFVLIIAIASTIACNSSDSGDSKKVVIAENILASPQFVKDSLWSTEDWEQTYKYDKELLYKTICDAVLSGKLKAYSLLSETPYSISEFKAIMDELVSAESISKVDVEEKMVFDSDINKIVSTVKSIHFLEDKFDTTTGERLGYRSLFKIKF